MKSELDFLRRLRRRAARTAPGLTLGVGDDAAILNFAANAALVVSSDLMAEDVHFRRRYFPPDALGHKILAVNLSDMAAMGAAPRFCLLSLALPNDCADAFADAFFDGFFALADRHAVALVGGDTSRSAGGVFLDATVIGETFGNEARRRSTARPGDAIYVSGRLGAAAAGFRLLEALADDEIARLAPAEAECVTRHLRPEPRVALGRRLARAGAVSAMMDVSDGLSLDLTRLCEASGVGARIFAEWTPVSDGAHAVAARFNLRAQDLALNGGEDYELLFTVPPPMQIEVDRLVAEEDFVSVTRIGVVTEASAGLTLVRDGEDVPLAPRGFDHFS
jgi:thiamine-monophosphate kinase